MSEREEKLTGGNVTQVVKIGDTVRRTAGPQTPSIQRLLAHVHAKGLHWVPKPLGFDEAGREVLSFIPGVVPHELPEWIWAPEVLADVAKAIREWHDATADFVAQEAIWGLPASNPQEVICHNDFATYNCVFNEGRLVGVIDFDHCSPGSRIWDLAYAAYRFIPLMPGPDSRVTFPGERSPFGVTEMHERLNFFLERYAGAGGRIRFESSQLIRTAIDRLLALAAWTEDFVHKGGGVALVQHAAMYRSHAGWLASTSHSSFLPPAIS